MNFSISKTTLISALKSLTHCVEIKQTLPILGNLLLQVENSTLKMTATDAEVEISCTLPLELDCSNGESTIPAHKFLKICEQIPQDLIFVELKDGSEFINVSSARLTYKVASLPASDYPSRQELKTGFEVYKINLTQRELKESLSQIKFAMSKNDIRYYLNGCCLELHNGRLNIVATDGHRLAMCSKPFDLEEKEPTQIIIPRKAIVELLRLLKNSDENVKIIFNHQNIQFVLSDITLSSKLIDGRYPDYYSVIPHRPEHLVKITTKELKQALSRVAIFSNESNIVRLNMFENVLKMTTCNAKQEEAEENVHVLYNDGEFEIGFKINYLLDVLSAINTKEIDFCFNDSNSHCLITPHDMENVQYVIMSMRLTEKE